MAPIEAARPEFALAQRLGERLRQMPKAMSREKSSSSAGSSSEDDGSREANMLMEQTGAVSLAERLRLGKRKDVSHISLMASSRDAQDASEGLATQSSTEHARLSDERQRSPSPTHPRGARHGPVCHDCGGAHYRGDITCSNRRLNWRQQQRAAEQVGQQQPADFGKGLMLRGRSEQGDHKRRRMN